MHTHTHLANNWLPRWPNDRESACQGRRSRRHGYDPRVGMIPWRRKWQPTPVFLPGKPQEQRSLVGYRPWGHKESDMTEQLNHNNMGWIGGKANLEAGGLVRRPVQ